MRGSGNEMAPPDAGLRRARRGGSSAAQSESAAFAEALRTGTPAALARAQRAGTAGVARSTSDRPRKRRPQARALATRARLLAAAQELFTRQGEEATTMQDVAQRAGVGVGTVYHHFADKRALLLELIDQYGEAVAARRRSELELAAFLGHDPRGAIHRWLTRAYERLRAQPTLYLVILALAERDAEVRQRYHRIEELSIERLRILIEFAQSRGLARSDVEPAAAAFLIHHAIDMAAMQLLVHDRRGPDPETVLRELAEMICRYVLEETP